ncbi:hypothetical protein FDB42_17275 [Clostridium botulinum]|nr:hypothetical protein [Clostridium botulinum]
MCIEVSAYEGIDNHHMKCNYCGKFMIFKGTTKTYDTEADNYECECGVTATVCNMDSEHDVLWSK